MSNIKINQSISGNLTSTSRIPQKISISSDKSIPTIVYRICAHTHTHKRHKAKCVCVIEQTHIYSFCNRMCARISKEIFVVNYFLISLSREFYKDLKFGCEHYSKPARIIAIHISKCLRIIDLIRIMKAIVKDKKKDFDISQSCDNLVVI